VLKNESKTVSDYSANTIKLSGINNMDEFLGVVFQFVLWYIFFKIVFEILALLGTRKQVVAERAELVSKITKLIHYVNQEKHGNCYYWFDKETDQFLGQGQTDEEIKQHLKSRFQGHVFVLDDNRALFGPELKVVALDQLPRLFNEKTNAS